MPMLLLPRVSTGSKESFNYTIEQKTIDEKIGSSRKNARRQGMWSRETIWTHSD